jgi:hypothetical protein
MESDCGNFERMKRILPGAYRCSADHLHLDLEEMCLGAGYPPTMHNQTMLENEMRNLAGEHRIKVQTVSSPSRLGRVF